MGDDLGVDAGEEEGPGWPAWSDCHRSHLEPQFVPGTMPSFRINR